MSQYFISLAFIKIIILVYYLKSLVARGVRGQWTVNYDCTQSCYLICLLSILGYLYWILIGWLQTRTVQIVDIYQFIFHCLNPKDPRCYRQYWCYDYSILLFLLLTPNSVKFLEKKLLQIRCGIEVFFIQEKDKQNQEWKCL